MRGWTVLDGGFPAWNYGGGVYALYQSGTLVYVGRTGNFRARLQAHRQRFAFNAIKVARIDESGEQKVVERRLLHRLRPAKNDTVPRALNAVWWYWNR